MAFLIIIPGFLVALATFPGVILHEYAHKKACEWVNLTVYEVKYFRLGNPAGYVLHEHPHSFGQALVITMAPLLINTFAEILVFLLAQIVRGDNALFLLLIWLAISFGMHAIPSTGDAKVLWYYSKISWRYEKKAVLGFPIAAIVYLLSLAKMIWIDLFYALGVMWVVSELIKVPFIW
ncbi:MAG: metalloprotease family protein [Ignisphaera sp.]